MGRLPIRSAKNAHRRCATGSTLLCNSRSPKNGQDPAKGTETLLLGWKEGICLILHYYLVSELRSPQEGWAKEESTATTRTDCISNGKNCIGYYRSITSHWRWQQIRPRTSRFSENIAKNHRERTLSWQPESPVLSEWQNSKQQWKRNIYKNPPGWEFSYFDKLCWRKINLLHDIKVRKFRTRWVLSKSFFF